MLVASLGMAVAAVRISVYHQVPGPFDPARQGFCDFHNGVYFPSLAFARRISPYSQGYADTYPVSRQVPPYSPWIIALHVPFALLPLAIAEVCYFLFMIACVVAIAWILVRDTGDWSKPQMGLGLWPVVALIVWSRPGHVTLFNGYFTFELVLGTFLALSAAKSRPWLAAVGIGLASGKPTYFLPLVLLMAARGDYAALSRGVVLSTFGGLLSMLWLTGPSVPAMKQFVDDVFGGQAVHMNDPLESPVTSWIRIDLPAVLAKGVQRDLNEIVQVGCMAILLAVPAWMLWRTRRHHSAAGVTDLSGSLILIASVTAIYHNAYDAILLVAPLVGWWTLRWDAMPDPRQLDRAIVGCLLIPLVNPLSTFAFLQRFEWNSLAYQVITSINAIAIFTALVLVIWRMWRSGHQTSRLSAGVIRPAGRTAVPD